MKRGNVWWVNFDPSIGGEVQKRRPAVIVSNNVANRVMNRVQVVPLTSNTARIRPGETAVLLNGQPNKAVISQITTVSKDRFINFAGRLSHQIWRRLSRK